MQFDAPFLQVLAPLMFVVGALYLLGPTLPISRPWTRYLVFGTVWLVIARYLNWRINRQVNAEDTVLIERVQAGMASSTARLSWTSFPRR